MNSPQTPSAAQHLMWPIIGAFVLFFLTVTVKLLLDAQTTKSTSRQRAGALFRAFFFAPDLLILTLSLLLSSQLLRSVLDSRSLVSNYGESFSRYLLYLLVIVFALLLVVSILWLAGEPRYKNLPLTEVQERVIAADGTSQSLTVFKVHIFSGLFATRAGLVNLVLSNLIGIASLVAYAAFIYYGFFQVPPWR